MGPARSPRLPATPPTGMSGMNAANTSGMGAQSVLPDELKGFNWGAFLLSLFWSIAHNTWIGLIVLVPYVGWIMSFVLGFKGNEFAWQNRKWDSVEHFKATQKVWMTWGIGIVAGSLILSFLFFILAMATGGMRNIG